MTNAWTSNPAGRVTASFIITVLAILLGSPAGAATVGATVQYTAGRLSVRATAAPRDVILNAIGAETGAAIHGDLANVDPLTIAFDDETLQSALERVIGPQSFTVRFDDDGRVHAIDLLRQSAQPFGVMRVDRVSSPVVPTETSAASEAEEVDDDSPASGGSPVDAAAASVAADDADGFAAAMKALYGDQTMDLLRDQAAHGDTAHHRRFAARAMTASVLFEQASTP